MNKKLLNLLAGLAIIILGILAISDEELALVLCGIMFFIYGFADLMRWADRRRSGTASIWTLLGSLLSFTLGVCIFIGKLGAVRFSVSFLVVILSAWLIISGVFEILGAIMYRKAMTTVDLGVWAPGSMTSIISGGIMIAVGLLALIVPVFAIFTLHFWISAGLIISGMRLIAAARGAGELEGIAR